MLRIRSRSLRLTRLELALGSSLVLGLGVLTTWLLSSESNAEAEQSARQTAGQLLNAVSDWKKESRVNGCPTVSQLMFDRTLKRSTPTDDPWGGRFRIQCSAAEVQVRSAGSDGQFQTADDIALSTDWQS